jgi:hypothetical protein
VFENRVLTRILAPRREEITEDWGKLHNEEFSGLYLSPYRSFSGIVNLRRISWAGYARSMGEE